MQAMRGKMRLFDERFSVFSLGPSACFRMGMKRADLAIKFTDVAVQRLVLTLQNRRTFGSHFADSLCGSLMRP
jgi:hypothetical protein